VTRSQSDPADASPDEQDADPSMPAPDEIRATACTTAPGRTLLVEEGNCDGWLSSDLVLDVSDHR
jgi:hypothetical protein